MKRILLILLLLFCAAFANADLWTGGMWNDGAYRGSMFMAGSGGGEQPAPTSEYTAKTVVIDIDSNYGDATYTSLRSMEFYYEDSLIALTDSDFTAYGAYHSDETLAPDHIWDTTNSKTGGSNYNQWINSGTTNRVVVVFDSAQTFDAIVVNNGHDTGADLARGAQAIKVWITDDTYTNATYQAAVTNGTKIFDGNLSRHVCVNVADDQTIIGAVPTGSEFPDPSDYAVKTLVMDVHNNYGDPTYSAMRRMEFYKDGSRIDLTDSDFMTYGEQYMTSFARDHLWDTTLSKTGDDNLQGWLMQATSGRVLVVLNNGFLFDSIVINNAHDTGNTTERGCQAIEIWITEDTYTNTTYQAAVTNGTKIFDGIVAEHVGSNVVDDQTLTLE